MHTMFKEASGLRMRLALMGICAADRGARSTVDEIGKHCILLGTLENNLRWHNVAASCPGAPSFFKHPLRF